MYDLEQEVEEAAAAAKVKLSGLAPRPEDVQIESDLNVEL